MVDDQFKKHAIQLIQLDIYQLSARIRMDEDDAEDDNEGDSQNKPQSSDEFQMVVGSIPYEKESNRKYVKLTCQTYGVPENKEGHPGYDIVVDISAVFSVDESEFPIEFIDDWGDKNAPLIIYPYVREAITSLNYRCGITDVPLPLFEVPTFRVEAEKASAESAD